MGNEVYANKREVSCKAADGKSICAFPDVCMTPPENPATPPGVPIPYPNTGMASDTTKGSRKVKITKKEVMLKNKSYFKKSMGDEAGSAAKKGVITSTNRGKVYFISWSMDVKVEKSSVVRMGDQTTHNHMSVPGNSPPWLYTDGVDMPPPDVADKCKDDFDTIDEVCKDDPDPCAAVPFHKSDGSLKDKRKMTVAEADTMRAGAKQNDCLVAQRCKLQTYNPSGCCPGQTPHHLVEKSSFKTNGQPLGAANRNAAKPYVSDKAPCICVEGNSQYRGSHAEMHTIQGWMNSGDTDQGGSLTDTSGNDHPDRTISYQDARDNAAVAVSTVFPESACSEDCIKAQLDHYHCDHCGVQPDDKIHSEATGWTSEAEAQAVMDNLSPPSGVPSIGM